MWKIKEDEAGLGIEDSDGQIIARISKPAQAVDDAWRKQARVMAAAPDLLKLCQGKEGASRVENLRQLAQTLERLTQGPIKAPLDQQMFITNELLAWRDYLRQLADEIESVLEKIERG